MLSRKSRKEGSRANSIAPVLIGIDDEGTLNDLEVLQHIKKHDPVDDEEPSLEGQGLEEASSDEGSSSVGGAVG